MTFSELSCLSGQGYISIDGNGRILIHTEDGPYMLDQLLENFAGTNAHFEFTTTDIDIIPRKEGRYHDANGHCT